MLPKTTPVADPWTCGPGGTGHRIRMIKPKQIEEPFGWFETVGTSRAPGIMAAAWWNGFYPRGTTNNLIRISTIFAD
jgi:hypothetical protein